MPRSPRASFLGFPHLIVAQANGGCVLFDDDEDYAFYLGMLRQMARDRFVQIYGFCLQRSELRLVLSPQRLPLARVMQRMHTSHTMRMNQKLERRGSLFRGRFSSMMFPREEIAQVVRSVHLWPVRSGIARRAEAYNYSSHAAYVGVSDPWYDLLEIDEVLVQFDQNPLLAQRAFGRYVESVALEEDDFGVPEIIQGIGGLSESVTEILELQANGPQRKRRASLRTLAQRVCLLLGVSWSQLQTRSRRQDLVMARRLFATAAVMGAKRSNAEVAAFLGRDEAQISRLVSQGLDMIEQNEPFRELYESAQGRSPVKHKSVES